MLALRRKTVVTVSAIVDALWPEAPPARVRNQIQVYVAGLRRLLGSDAVARHVIRTRTGGYLLDVPAGWVDVARFEETAACSKAADCRWLSRRSRSACSEPRWPCGGGPALGGLAGRFFEEAATRLNERRMTVLEQHTHVQLALNRPQEVIGDLRVVVGANPLHEGLRRCLMLALNRAGRPRRSARRVSRGSPERIVAELGIEPGPELQVARARHHRGRANLE